MVQFFADQMKALVESGLDLVFCNEVEAMQFTGAADIPAAKEALKAVAKGFVITLGDKGAVAWDGEKFYDIVANTVEAKDTNGAGDMFAGAFLYGITNGMDYAQAGALASKAASQVVSKFGPRLTRDQAQSLL
jgi:Sugar kinases, ribokinase family